MSNLNTKQIHTEFLRAAYCTLFGTCPNAETIEQLIPETNENGRQKS
jgi:hypothetical protein